MKEKRDFMIATLISIIFPCFINTDGYSFWQKALFSFIFMLPVIIFGLIQINKTNKEFDVIKHINAQEFSRNLKATNSSMLKVLIRREILRRKLNDKHKNNKEIEEILNEHYPLPKDEHSRD
jgi:hypothetical protein